MSTDHSIVVAGLFVYPVKSLRGMPVDQVMIQGGRVVGDREWLLVDQREQFMHQRDYPQMARLTARPTDRGLILEADGLMPGRPSIEVPRPDPGVPVEYIRLWRRHAPARPAGGEVAAWLTAALGVPARLVAFAPDAPPRDAPDSETEAAFQDATPFHIVSCDSLDDLGRRIGWPIPVERFRPNLVLAGAEPYAEDTWQRIRIAGTAFSWLRACTRCKITMTDHRTGERTSPEPLRTLATYRRRGSEVVFGHYFTAAGGQGPVRVGDGAQVLELAP